MPAPSRWFQLRITVLLRLAMLMSIVAVLAPGEVQAARQVSAKRECAICHVMWLKEFKRKDVTPLIPYDPKPVVKTGRQDVASTKRMCFSCHDGFVLDSRFLWLKKRHNHPVGVKPSKKIKIPTSGGKIVFPLNDDGKVYCGTCHTAHGVSWSQTESPIFLRVKNVDSSLCLACHLDHSTGPKEGNHPIFQKPPKTPTNLIKAGSKLGTDGSVICQSCHRPHGARGRHLLVLNNKSAELCRSCHTDKGKVLRTKHDLTVMAPKTRNSKGEPVSEDGPCSACHALHGAKGPVLLARESKLGTDPITSACLNCHNPKGLAKKKVIGKHSHPNFVAISKLNITPLADRWLSPSPLIDSRKPLTPLPLYDIRGERVRLAGKVICATCHDPHVWSPSAKAKPQGDPRKIEGGGNNSFLRIAQGTDSKLCTNCHVDKRSILASKHNAAVSATPANAAKWKAAKRSLALNDGVCGNCHMVHNGKASYMRARGGGPGKANIKYLCEDCHRKGGLAGKEIVGPHSHPIGVNLKKVGGHTSLPLYLAGTRTKSKNGTIDCATCHNVHQWNPRDITSRAGASRKVEGDGRTSFLRIRAAPSADLCVNCHKQQRWVRGTDHDLRVTAPHAVNAQGETIAQSGVCGQCHSVHNAELALNLWARSPGLAPDAKEMLCRSCHQRGAIAEAKLPLKARHPEKVVVWSNKARPRIPGETLPVIPVFNRQGERGVTGLITCTSCHNPHQWNPAKPQEGSGKNLEGDALTSFLRNSNTDDIVCADCHGTDGLFRYKYFHAKTSRVPYPLYGQ